MSMLACDLFAGDEQSDRREETITTFRLCFAGDPDGWRGDGEVEMRVGEVPADCQGSALRRPVHTGPYVGVEWG
jgi:hypothetical protein